MNESKKKYRIVFPFVEAGLGHIMPMRAVCDAFEKKYGEQCEVIRTKFFQDKNDLNMKFVEDELVREVKLHNKKKLRGNAQFALMRFFGPRASLKYLMERRYGRGYRASLNYIKELNADLIFSTHFSTLYYACKARKYGLIGSEIAMYCPDPILGLQWDNRGDLYAISSSVGQKKAKRGTHFKHCDIREVPFMIRPEIIAYTQGKAYYRSQLGLPQDKFTILLSDGAYGAGKLRATVLALLKTQQKITVLAVCGKNEALYREFLTTKVPENITFVPYGFTDKTLALAASCDLFMGKAGASNLAEPTYFGAPSIVTFLASPVEKWICEHYTSAGCAVKILNVNKAVELACRFAENPQEMVPYITACKPMQRCDGPERLADILWERLKQSEVQRPAFTCSVKWDKPKSDDGRREESSVKSV